jgi:putative DNA primase/helicase
VTIDELSVRLRGVRRTSRGLSALCPAHADRHNSLGLATGRDGRLLIRCWTGCATETILAALRLSWCDLFAVEGRRSARRSHPERPVVCELDAVRTDLLARERRLAKGRDRWADVMDLADEARSLNRLIARARAVVDELGDTDEAWSLEAQATTLELMMWTAETRALAVVGHRLW